MPEISPGTLKDLRRYDSATVANVIELFEVRPRNRGFMSREITAAFPELPHNGRFAATATCRLHQSRRQKSCPA